MGAEILLSRRRDANGPEDSHASGDLAQFPLSPSHVVLGDFPELRGEGRLQGNLLSDIRQLPDIVMCRQADRCSRVVITDLSQHIVDDTDFLR